MHENQRLLENFGEIRNKSTVIASKEWCGKSSVLRLQEENCLREAASLLGNGVGEGEKGPAHAVGELVKQDPGIVRGQAITGVIQFWRRGLFVCTDCDLLVLIMT